MSEVANLVPPRLKAEGISSRQAGSMELISSILELSTAQVEIIKSYGEGSKQASEQLSSERVVGWLKSIRPQDDSSPGFS